MNVLLFVVIVVVVRLCCLVCCCGCGIRGRGELFMVVVICVILFRLSGISNWCGCYRMYWCLLVVW